MSYINRGRLKKLSDMSKHFLLLWSIKLLHFCSLYADYTSYCLVRDRKIFLRTIMVLFYKPVLAKSVLGSGNGEALTLDLYASKSWWFRYRCCIAKCDASLLRQQKLLYCISYTIWIDWLIIFCTLTGGWEFDRSHGAGISSPSHWQQVEEQTPKPWDDWCVSSWWPLFPSRSSVLKIYICIYYMSSVIGRIYIHTTGVSFSIGEDAPHHIL